MPPKKGKGKGKKGKKGKKDDGEENYEAPEPTEKENLLKAEWVNYEKIYDLMMR